VSEKIERITIDRIGHQGDGVATEAGGSIFVPYTLPGETVEIERAGIHAKLRKILSPSSDRITPVCQHFGVCGGCAVQHWRHEKYLAWKRGLVEAALSRESIHTSVGEIMDAHGDGRRRAVLHVRRTGKALVAGFAGRRSHTIIAIDRCPILAPVLARAIPVTWKIAEVLDVNGKPIDVQFTATEAGLDVDVRGSGLLDAKTIEKLAAIAVEERLARITRHGESVSQLAEPAIQVGKARVILPSGAFLQATEAGEAALVELVWKAAGSARAIADLFCGVGTFALRLAEQAKILAVDYDAPAIAALSRAAKMPGLRPVSTILRDVFHRPLVAPELKEFDAVVLDPPRQGAEAQARELSKSKVPRVVYVSCNPASFARDARILSDSGLTLSSVTPVDQFRYSPHVELVGVFKR
jgi:23S rRNA (uracil1939-C5)-methyltransferase